MKKLLNWLLNHLQFVIFLAIAIFASRKFLFFDGYVLFGEFLTSKNYSFFLMDFLKAWSDTASLGHSNIGFPSLFALNPTFFITSPGLHIPWSIILSFMQFFLGDFTSKVYILVALLTPFLGMYYFAKFWLKRLSKTLWIIESGAFVAALIYGTNPQIGDRVFAGHLHYVFGYGLFPLFLLTIFKAVESKQVKETKIFFFSSILIFATLFWFMLHMLIISLIPLGIYFLLFIIPDVRKIVRFFIILVLVTLAGFLLNIHAWLPALFYSESYPFLKDITYNLGALYHNSKFTSAKNILTLTSNFELLYLIEKSKTKAFFLLKLFLPILGILGLLINKERKKSLFIVLLALMGVVFATGLNYGFKNIYLFLYKNFFLFKVLRDNSKFIILYAFSLALIVPVVYIYLANKLKKGVLLLIPLITIFVLATNPLFTSGDFGGAITSFTYPEKYQLLKKFLDNKEKFRVAMYPNEGTISDYDWFPKSANGPIFLNVYNSFDPINNSLAISNRTTSDLTSRYLDFLESHLDQKWATDRLGEEMIKYLIVDHSLPGFQKTLDLLKKNPGITEVETIAGFNLFKVNTYKPDLVKKITAVYYFGNKNGLAYLPSNVSLIDLGINSLNVLTEDYSNTVILFDSSINDVFLTSLVKYRFSFFPEVRFNVDGTSSYIVAGDNLREAAIKGINFFNPETILTVGPNSIQKKSYFKKGKYKIFASILSGESQTSNVKFSINGNMRGKTIPRNKEATFQWIDFGEIDLAKENPMITLINGDQNTLVLDSLLIVPSYEYEKLRKEFLASISNKKILRLENQTPSISINSDTIFKVSHSYSPYWDACGSKTFIVDFYGLGVKCPGKETVRLKFIPERLYITSLILSAVFYLVIIANIAILIKLKFHKRDDQAN